MTIPAKEITPKKANLLKSSSSPKVNYMFEFGGKRIDGSAEICKCHPRKRVMGRLLNWGDIRKGHVECNVRPVGYSFDGMWGIVFAATRVIEPLEELRYDYNDKHCRVVFLGEPESQ